MKKHEAIEQLEALHKNVVTWAVEDGEGSDRQLAAENALFDFLSEELQIDNETIQEGRDLATLPERLKWASEGGEATISMAFDD